MDTINNLRYILLVIKIREFEYKALIASLKMHAGVNY
jgi:hypothetical protein